MKAKKQKLLIEYLISSPDTFTICQNIVEYKYFDPEYRNSVKFIKEYYEEYSTTPNPQQIEAETDQEFKLHDISPDEVKYVCIEIEKFCKYSAMKHASLILPGLIQEGIEDETKYSEARELVTDAVLVSLHKDLGLRYFETVDERIQRMLNEDPTTSTGWDGVDDALFGGISRKELLLVSANSGGGKSITLANLAFNFLNQNLNVLYISLELSEDVIAQRFDTMFTGIGRKEWKENTDAVSKGVKHSGKDIGILDIIQMPTATTSNQIRSYLKEYYLNHKMTPDLLVLDYIDNMAPNEHVSADNVFEKDKRSSEQLRQIGVDHNMYMATASQLNRQGAVTSDHNQSHIAGGISKIHVADVYWSIIFTPEMRAQGKIIFIFQKTRNSDGLGKQVHLKWLPKYLRMVNEEEKAIVFNAKKEEEDDEPTGDKLMGLIDNLL